MVREEDALPPSISADDGVAEKGWAPIPGAPVPASFSPPPAVVQRRLIVWDANGVPVPATVPMIAKSQLEELAAAAISLPYDGVEEEFKGMSCAEVMLIRMARKAASGDEGVAEKLLDRILGKPKQSSEVKSLRMSYEDVLKEMAAKDAKAKVVDVTPAPLDPLSEKGVTEIF